VKAAVITEPTHNSSDETYWASCLRENLTSSSYGEGLETDRKAPRQSLTRQTFHKIMKSGCKTEESKLRTAERLVNLIATFCIMSWRIFWMTMINRSAPDIAPEIALTGLEVTLLDQLVKDKASRKPASKTLTDYLTKIAQLGGYLARSRDPPPGNMVMWRGLARLTDIELGFILARENVGN
jgi:hypothetical protein